MSTLKSNIIWVLRNRLHYILDVVAVIRTYCFIQKERKFWSRPSVRFWRILLLNGSLYIYVLFTIWQRIFSKGSGGWNHTCLISAGLRFFAAPRIVILSWNLHRLNGLWRRSVDQYVYCIITYPISVHLFRYFKKSNDMSDKKFRIFRVIIHVLNR